ncbi:hypothetical protein [Geobacter sp. SVR]|uniref:PKD domain-containing protein n=1 Tax=Geobacter sp. SVR TaxID=2495594 RepID=UPI00143F012C|nr:hypothetical protein [Geobacter sp. SVR]BCS53265.1 hypothetical protein GSVR_15730 [Geobacter sp. SVR]GCF84651.1 hypothetical protein GSbR_12510 [Geobacter sp. SVR]
MFKKSLMVMTTLLALPAFANAWSVNAKTSTTGQGTITPSGTQTYVAGQDSGEYAVSPAVGYTISRVTLDGLQAAPNGNGKYVAPYDAAKSTRYMVAYFATKTVNITTSATGSGAVREDTFESLTNVPAGSARQIVILPNPGYQISAFDPADGTVTDNPLGFAPGSKLVSFTNLQANKTVSATFSLIPVFDVSAGSNVTLNAPGAAYAVNLVGSATSNQGSIAYTWSNNSGTALIFGTPNASSTTVYANAAGTYTAKLSAVSNGVTQTATATVTVLDGKTFYLNQCTSCHSQNNPNLVADYTAGAHGTASGHTTGTCQRCHATDGAIAGAAAGWTGSQPVLVANQTAVWNPVQPTVSAAGVGCIVCHDSHNGLRPVNTYVSGAKVAWDPNANGKVDQYDVCTSCHTLTDSTGALVGNYHDGSVVNYARTISDSHYDNPTTTAIIEGYVVRTKSDTPCADCHNLHQANVDIQDEWATSGHAGKIATQKDTAGTGLSGAAAITARKAAGVDETSGAAWVHYNWDQTQGTGNRATCEKCHTSTGAANYMNDPANYNPANNDFSHLSGWTPTAGSPQNELLYCWGCHSDSQTGAMRNPGAVVADYKFNGAPAVYPNVGATNVCITCHDGQASGNSITDLTAAGNNFTNVSFVNSHYMAAAGLTYAKIGYTNFVPAQTQVAGTTGTGIVSYGQTMTSDADTTKDITGATVAGKLTSTHRNLGTVKMNGDSHNPAFFVAGNLDSDGPCVTCHYAGTIKVQVAGGPAPVTAKDHTLEMGQAQLTNVCGQCHASEAADVAGLQNFIEEQAVGFQNSLALALSLLQSKYHITYDQSVYPYFYDQDASNGAVKNWTRPVALGANALSAANAEKLMGACFNINLLKRDPAAYVHARSYARRLLYDTIDFLDDNIINQSAGTTAIATDPAHFGKGATAYTDSTLKTLAAGTTDSMVYLLGWSRTTGAWNAYERP